MSEAAEEGWMGKWDEMRRGIFRASVVEADDNASLLQSLGKGRIADEKSCERTGGARKAGKTRRHIYSTASVKKRRREESQLWV